VASALLMLETFVAEPSVVAAPPPQPSKAEVASEH
jgi:hypothetical protein